MEKRFDVTSVGSTMIRLSVPVGERLETCGAFDVRTAGSESNTLAALARMGMRTAWVSRLCDNSLGRRIAGDISGFGTDTSQVIWTESERNEVFFVEYGASPRPIQVIYDRMHSAVASMRCEDINLNYLLDTKILHLTGIFPALSPSCAQITNYLIESAQKASVKISFDLNYRKKLWESPETAGKKLGQIIEKVDILILTREDAGELFGCTGSPEKTVKEIYRMFSPKICVLTLGREGGCLWNGDRFHIKPGYRVREQDRLGAGDAFTAGILAGYLEGSSEQGLEYATAMAALKMGINGDYFVSNKDEVLALINSEHTREVGR